MEGFKEETYRDRFNQFPLCQAMGFTLLRAGEGAGKVSCIIKEEWKNSLDVLHGGVISSLVDVSIAAAIKSIMGESARFTTIELKVNFLLPVREEMIFAESKVVRKGRHIVFGTCEVKGGKGEILSYGTGTFYILD